MAQLASKLHNWRRQLQTVDAGIYDVNAFIADTTQFELISFYGAAYRQGSISVSSIVFGLVASDNSVHRSLELAASPVSTTTNNNNDDDINDNEEDNEDDGDRLPPLRLVVDLRRLRQWFQTMQWPSNVAVRLFFVRSFVRSPLIKSIDSQYNPIGRLRLRATTPPDAGSGLVSTIAQLESLMAFTNISVIDQLTQPVIESIMATQTHSKYASVVAKFTVRCQRNRRRRLAPRMLFSVESTIQNALTVCNIRLDSGSIVVLLCVFDFLIDCVCKVHWAN